MKNFLQSHHLTTFFLKIRLIVNDYTMSPDKQNELIELLSYNQKSNIYKDETQKNASFIRLC